jgi:hypothetical protein
LKETQCKDKDKILKVSEFDAPFLRFEFLPKERTVILCLQGFGVVSIIGLNTNLARIGDLVIQVSHTRMYTRIQI